MEIFLIGIITIFMLNYLQKIDTRRFFNDNSTFLLKLKEPDFDFLIKAKYGDKFDPNKLFEKRIKESLLIFLILFLVFITKLNFINILICVVLAIVDFLYLSNYSYFRLKSYYKSHLHEIDLLLPYYLKSLEILIQHYTVPVAISKSVDTAPAIFKEGLEELISSINAGNSSIDPYMDFAKKYPVRDSMRMMRLLYRLGLGEQERKQEQLIVFSKTISNLQGKARETKYKERLEKMEKKTMMMLSITGIGIMIILLLSILQMFKI